MPAFARRFVVVLAAVLLVGCGPEPRHLYTWGDKVEVLAPEKLRRLCDGYRRADFPALP